MTDESTAARLRDVVFSYGRTDTSAGDQSGDGTNQLDSDSGNDAVLRGIDLDIPVGDIVVVMGASGGGKSTLLQTFNALIPGFVQGLFDGEVDILGRDATTARTSELAEAVGTVFQDYEAQLFSTTVEAEVAFGPENLAVPPEAIESRIDQSLAFAGLEDLDRRRSPAALSGGQKQRLVLASVLAMHPELLVLDEPTSDLDPKGTRETVEIVRSLASTDSLDEGAGWTGPETIVLVTHKVEEALLADRAVVLRDGSVFRDGPVEDVFTDTAALEQAHVAVPPLVDAFDRVGWPEDDFPITVADAVERVEASNLSWTPPAADAGAPAGTGTDVTDSVFEVSGLVHEFETDRKTIRAVDDIDFTVRKGEVVAVVGHNGSGKTTLAKHLNGLLDPDEGTVTWRGTDVRELTTAELGRRVGYVFQNPDHQLFESTVEAEVAFGPENFGLEGDELASRVDHAVEAVELDALVDEDPFSLSKGQRQRVALASVLATDPEVIVFDEPTTGLDAEQQRSFMDLVARLNRESGLTVVMVTHDMHTVARYAPRTVVMEDGRKVADGPTRTIFANPETLDSWGLNQPQPVAFSNTLADDAESPPALSVDEVVAGLGGENVVGGDEV